MYVRPDTNVDFRYLGRRRTTCCQTGERSSFCMAMWISCSQLVLQCKEDLITKELVESEQTLQCYAQEFNSHEIVFYPFHTHQVTDWSRSPVFRVDLQPEILPAMRCFFRRSLHPRGDRSRTWPSASPDLSATTTRRLTGFRSCRRKSFWGAELPE